MNVTVSTLQPAARFNLRVGKDNRTAVAKALGCDLPEKIGSMAERPNLRALCLGPDEWQLDAAESGVQAALAAIYPNAPHSLTDISDREITFCLQGPRAAELLTVGCPRDLKQFAKGSGARTVFDTVQAVLIRETEERFTLSVWRSFAPHVSELLDIAQAEFSAGL